MTHKQDLRHYAAPFLCSCSRRAAYTPGVSSSEVKIKITYDVYKRQAQFWEFTQYMNELYHNSPEYQSLPEAQGGYM